MPMHQRNYVDQNSEYLLCEAREHNNPGDLTRQMDVSRTKYITDAQEKDLRTLWMFQITSIG